MAIITIVGAGMMGSAMCFPASDNQHFVRLVGTPYDKEVIERIQNDGFHPKLQMFLPRTVTAYQFEQLNEALDGTDLLISGVPSFGVDWFADNVLKVIPDTLKVLSLTKGLEITEDGELLPISIAYSRKIAPRALSINSIGGPCISTELCLKQHTTVALCGENMDDLQWIKKLLATSYYHINLTTDVAGIECAVALKNAYAVGVSLAIGLAEHQNQQLFNPQASLFGQAVREMLRLTKLLNGHTDAVIYATSDLFVTINGGRNRKLGEYLGQGDTFENAMKKLSGVTLESIPIITKAAQAIRIAEQKHTASFCNFPLLRHLDAMINHGGKLAIPWEEFG